jgi:hypothetical protein
VTGEVHTDQNMIFRENRNQKYPAKVVKLFDIFRVIHSTMRVYFDSSYLNLAVVV